MLSFDILADYTCLQHPEMAAKLYSPVYSPGVSAKNPQKNYATLAKWRIALPPIPMASTSHHSDASLRGTAWPWVIAHA